MDNPGSETMINEQQLENFVTAFKDENRETLSIVRECMSSVNRLAGNVESLSEQSVEMQKQMVAMLTKQEGHKEKSDLLFETLVKGHENLAHSHKNLEGKMYVMDSDLTETMTKVNAMPEMFDRIRRLEEYKNFVSGETQGQRRVEDKVENRTFKLLPYIKGLIIIIFSVGMTIGYFKQNELSDKATISQTTTGK